MFGISSAFVDRSLSLKRKVVELRVVAQNTKLIVDHVAREDIEKLEQEKTRAASEHVQQMDRDHKRADSLPHSIGEEDRTTKNNAYTADTTWKVEESVDHTVEVDNELEGSLNHSTHSSALVKDGWWE